ncbi:MAG: DUF3796 domain-containing protein [Patescibacteria group bacterium]
MLNKKLFGFMGFMGFQGIPGIMSGDWVQAIWVVWFVWFIYFFIPNDEASTSSDKEGKQTLMEKQAKEKADNLGKILNYFNGREKVTNDEVQSLLGVSDATTENYLDQLEKEGKIVQMGKTGSKVYYTKV